MDYCQGSKSNQTCLGMIENTPDNEANRGEKAVAHSTIFFLFCPRTASFDHIQTDSSVKYYVNYKNNNLFSCKRNSEIEVRIIHPQAD